MAVKKDQSENKDNVFNKPGGMRPDTPGGSFFGYGKKLKPTSKYYKAAEAKRKKIQLNKELNQQTSFLDTGRGYDLSRKGFQSPSSLKLKNSSQTGYMRITAKKKKINKINQQIPQGNFGGSSSSQAKILKPTSKFLKTQKLKTEIAQQQPGFFGTPVRPKVTSKGSDFEKALGSMLGKKVKIKKIETQQPPTQFGTPRQKLSPQQQNQLNNQLAPLKLTSTQSKGFDRNVPNLNMSNIEATKLGQVIAANPNQVIAAAPQAAAAGTLITGGTAAAVALNKTLTGVTTDDKEYQQYVDTDIGQPDEQLAGNLAEQQGMPDPENDLEDPQKQMTDPADDLKKEDIQVQEYTGDPMAEPGQIPIVMPSPVIIEDPLKVEEDQEDKEPSREYDGDPMTEPGQLPIVMPSPVIIEDPLKVEEDQEDKEPSREYDGDPMTEPGQLPIVMPSPAVVEDPAVQNLNELEDKIQVQEYTGDPMAEGMWRLKTPPPPPGEEPPPPPPPGEEPPPPPPPGEEPPPPGEEPPPPGDKEKKSSPPPPPPTPPPGDKKKKKAPPFTPYEEEKIIDGETRRPFKVNFTAVTPSGNNKVFYQADTLKGTIREVPAGSVEVNPGLGLESMKVESTTSRNPLIKSKRDLLVRAERKGLL